MALAVDLDLSRPPVQIADLESCDLYGAQPKPSEQHQDRVTANADSARAITRLKKPFDRRSRRTLRQPGVSPVSRRRHRGRQPGIRETAHTQVAQLVGVAANRSWLGSRGLAQQKPGHVSSRRGRRAQLVLWRDSLREEPSGQPGVPGDGVRRELALDGQPLPVFAHQSVKRRERSRGLGADHPLAAQVVQQRHRSCLWQVAMLIDVISQERLHDAAVELLGIDVVAVHPPAQMAERHQRARHAQR
jgi:hypothetical protein